MTINSYLTSIANQAILRDHEKLAVQRSVGALQQRLVAHFGPHIVEHFVFGSYGRGTILPRALDENSDVDYMVVFSDSNRQPQAYLDRLIKFADARYSRSEVAQSHPTAVLELNHIRFELVPAIRGWLGDLKIPAKRSNYSNWQETDPTEFNERLIRENKANNNLTKPLVRVLKYWNACAGYPFESYALEQKIVDQNLFFQTLFGPLTLADYFFHVVGDLETDWSAPQWARNGLARLKELSSKAREIERSGNIYAAEMTLSRIIPPIAEMQAVAMLSGQ